MGNDVSLQEQVERLGTYYRQFHHLCVGWYVTIMGLFIAGVIAAPIPDKAGQPELSLLLYASLGLAVFFVVCLQHYADRIERLNDLLYGDPKDIPPTWRVDHRHGPLRMPGWGLVFFYVVIAFMQVVLFYLLKAKNFL